MEEAGKNWERETMYDQQEDDVLANVNGQVSRVMGLTELKFGPVIGPFRDYNWAF